MTDPSSLTDGVPDALIALTRPEAAQAAVLFERMFPADRDPGARAIGVTAYLDRALAGHDRDKREQYRTGLECLDDAARHRWGTPLTRCSAEEVDELISALQDGLLPTASPRAQQSFFAALLAHLQEGLFSDPVHGGNRGMAGWRFLGHPGVWLDHTHAENLGREPADKGGEIQGLTKIAAAESERFSRSEREPRRSSPQPSFSDGADVIIVGVGAVGGLVAPEFARAGLKVVGFEAGPWRQAGDYAPDELTYSPGARAAFSTKFMAERPTWRPDPDSPAVPARASLGHMVNGVGGSALHYGAMLRRYHPHHFRERSHLLALGGEQALPPGSTVSDWPIGYSELEAFYDRVEQMIGVSGEAGNPFVPRSSPFPMPGLRGFRLGEQFRDAALALGLHPYTCPVGINSRPYDGRPTTRYNTWELTLGANNEAKWHPGNSSVPAALATGNFELRTDCRVVRILTDADGRACGVEYVDSDGERRRQEAKVVILSAYTLENVRLMFLSADLHRPHGLGNNRGQLGRHTMSRMFNSVYGEVPGEHFNLHTGSVAQNMLLEDFQAESFDCVRHGFAGGATLGAENGGLPIAVSRTALPPEVPCWGAGYKNHLRGWQSRAFIRIQADALPYEHHLVELDPDYRESTDLALPRLRITHRLEPNELALHRFMVERAREILERMGASRIWAGPSYTGVLSSHELGGCRMGTDPMASVVDPALEVHDTPSLFVYSGAAFPSGCGINPSLTLFALALRAADQLIDRFQRPRGAVENEPHRSVAVYPLPGPQEEN